MYLELVQTLTKTQIDELEQQGIPRSTVSNWKHGKRLPTRPQAVSLAKVTGCDWVALDAELAELEAPESKRPAIRAAIAAALLAAATATQAVPVMHQAGDGLYIMSTQLRAWMRRLLQLAASYRLGRFGLTPPDRVILQVSAA